MPDDKPTIRRKSTQLIPAVGDKEVGYVIFTILHEILADKDNLGLPQRWAYNYQLSRNKHWKQKSKKASLISANLLHRHRTNTVNQLTDNNPTFNIAKIGAQEGQEDIYDTLLHIIQHWWQDQEQQKVFRKSVLNGETNGVAIEKMVFNPDLEAGLGEAETLVIDPHHFGVYPVNVMDNQKAEANLFFRPMSLREARRRWPDSASKMKADKEILNDLGSARRELQTGGQGRSSQGWFTVVSNVIKHMVGNTTDQAGGMVDEEVLIVEAWVKDYSQEDGKPKYTGDIRQITVCNGGELVLEDRDNPSINPNIPPDLAQKTYLFDKFPFYVAQSITDNVSMWASSDYEQLSGLQIEFNKTLSQLGLFKDRVARLKIINPQDSGVPNSHLDNYPGIVQPSNRLVAQGLRYLEPPKNPIDLEAALNAYKDFFFLIAGSFDLEQARGRNADLAYKSIAALIERTITMMKDKIGNYGGLVRVRGRMYLSMAQNWYTEEREIPYEQDGEDLVDKVRGRDLIISPKLTVVSGSTMPVSRIQKREEAIVLADKGHIDTEELLKALDWPDWRKVIRRLKAGPFGQILEMLAQIGAPPEFLQFMQGLFQVDPKEFQKALQSGEVPSFNMIVQPQDQLEQGGDPAQEMEIQEKQASAQLKLAQAEKVMADIDLIQEKIISERIEQLVRSTGIQLDEEKLKIERAKIVLEMQKIMEASLVNDDNLEINRQKIGAELIKAKMQGTKSPEGTQRYDRKKGQGPFREKGFKSDNERLQ